MQIVQAVRHKKTMTSSCGVKGGMSSLSEIINGGRAAMGEWPWQVKVGSICGGTLLSPGWVLTAASCIPNADFSVVMGAYDLDKPSGHEVDRGVHEVFKHPLYSRNIDPKVYDVAMVRLNFAVQMNDYVRPACLPAANEEVTTNTSCWMTGWGWRSYLGGDPSVLQEAKLNIISNEDCVSTTDLPRVNESMLCARGKTFFGRIVDACGRDSGGPLVCERNGRWTLHGVTSYPRRGQGCGNKKRPTLWARVSKVTEWIQEFLDGGCPDCELAPPIQCDPTEGNQYCPGGTKCPECGTQRCDCPIE